MLKNEVSFVPKGTTFALEYFCGSQLIIFLVSNFSFSALSQYQFLQKVITQCQKI